MSDIALLTDAGASLPPRCFGRRGAARAAQVGFLLVDPRMMSSIALAVSYRFMSIPAPDHLCSTGFRVLAWLDPVS